MGFRVCFLTIFLSASCGDFVESDSSVQLETLDQSGGTVRFEALSVAVPRGALTKPTTLKVSSELNSNAETKVFRVEPANQVFEMPITIAIAVTSPTPIGELGIADFSHTPPIVLQNQRVNGQTLSALSMTSGLFGVLRCIHSPCEL